MKEKQLNNKKLREGGYFSLVLNAIFILLFLSIVVYKWDAIINKITSIVELTLTEKAPTEKELLNFNNDPIPFINGFHDVNADFTSSIVFLGNSLTLCTMPEEEPDKTKRGLTATSLEKDYVHLVINKISDRFKVNVEYSIANLAEFERTFMHRDFDFINRLRDNKVSDPDWVIIQLGENVAEKDLIEDEKYRKDVARLLSLFPNSKKIVTIPFWPSKAKQIAATQIALDNNCYIADLSHLGNGTDPSNFASSQRKYKIPGVGKHPGDIGMGNIANVIFSIINAEGN